MTAEELHKRQNWSLNQKIDHSLGVLEDFVSRLGGIDSVYLSFSGGKDSTVLLDIAKKIFPNILSVFCSTGMEYPEIIKFVRGLKDKGDNIEIIHPKLTPKEVFLQYGFPLISKETAEKIHRIRFNPNSKAAAHWLSSGYFSLPKCWRFLIDTQFETSHMCCHKLKKEPFIAFEKRTNRKPILGIMAAESRLRRGQYIKNGGCNVFGSRPSSRPLSIWTETDIWEYINTHKLPIAEIYNKGLDRTGCMLCGFGAQLMDDTRFEILKREHPKCYEMIMNYSNNGITFKEALKAVLEVSNKKLPEGDTLNLFNI